MWCRLQLQEFDRGVFRGAVVGVEGEEQWGENTTLRAPVLMVQVLDENFPSLTSCCLSVRKLVSTDRWRLGRRAVSVYSEGVRR